MKNQNRLIIIWANTMMAAMIIVHDTDHLRQAICWSYTIPWYVKLINIIVYVPSAFALLLAFGRRRLAALMTVFNGLFIATTFAKIHLTGVSVFPYWGIWNRSFFALEADSISWTILTATVITDIAVALAGTFVSGRLSLENAANHQ